MYRLRIKAPESTEHPYRASSGLSDDEVKRMKEEAQANAEAEQEGKERIDKLNQADSMIFQTEKQLKDLATNSRLTRRLLSKQP